MAARFGGWARVRTPGGLRLSAIVLAVVPLLILWEARGTPGAQQIELRQVGNEACRPCHAAIYDSYAATAMARTSGAAEPHVIEGAFYHDRSDVSYRVERQGDAARLSYERPGRNPLRGAHTLEYFIGSNTRGRTFLFEIEGFLYQSPINYFAAKRSWGMRPGHAQAPEMPLNQPVDSSCLFCHASRVQRPVESTINRFAGAPFLQAGVSCERCHGPGSEHVNGRGPMVNPAKLAEGPRDSVCIQCHLEGEARIAVADRTQYEFSPGEEFADHVAIFVREGAVGDRLGAVSQVEALASSACRRGSGAAMSCLTCHDPHVQPGAARRADYYRARCIGCHREIAATHQPSQPDCTSCHMPRVASADIAHTMVTDHRIVRTAQTQRASGPDARRLVEFGRAPARARELGLAYGEVALRGDAFAAGEALRLLEDALPRYPRDPDVLARLAQLHQARGDLERAEQLYARALEQDPDRAEVAANVGVFLARRGMVQRALELWRDAYADNPHLSDLGLNLANGLCAAGDARGAREVLRRLLAHDPDKSSARQLLAAATDANCRAP